jgi:hypothetical protein
MRVAVMASVDRNPQANPHVAGTYIVRFKCGMKFSTHKKTANYYGAE